MGEGLITNITYSPWHSDLGQRTAEVLERDGRGGGGYLLRGKRKKDRKVLTALWKRKALSWRRLRSPVTLMSASELVAAAGGAGSGFASRSVSESAVAGEGLPPKPLSPREAKREEALCENGVRSWLRRDWRGGGGQEEGGLELSAEGTAAGVGWEGGGAARGAGKTGEGVEEEVREMMIGCGDSRGGGGSLEGVGVEGSGVLSS
jgi:hypothetical protein